MRRILSSFQFGLDSDIHLWNMYRQGIHPHFSEILSKINFLDDHRNSEFKYELYFYGYCFEL